MTPQEYLKIEKEQQLLIDQAKKVMNIAFDMASKCPLPKGLRRATVADNVEGSVLWNPEADGRKWVIVEQVHDPSDAFWWAGGLYFIVDYYIEAAPNKPLNPN